MSSGFSETLWRTNADSNQKKHDNCAAELASMTRSASFLEQTFEAISTSFFVSSVPPRYPFEDPVDDVEDALLEASELLRESMNGGITPSER